MGEVVYRIKYEGSEKISVKRRVVHHNQLKRFHEVHEPETADDNNRGPGQSKSIKTDDGLVIIEGPVVAPEVEDLKQNNDQVEQPPRPADVAPEVEDLRQNNDQAELPPRPVDENEKPLRERRHPDRFVDYHMNF